MFLKRKLTSLLCLFFLTGCIITQHNDIHRIINDYTYEFSISENIEITNVAAILKEFSTQIHKKKYKNVNKISTEKKLYIKSLFTQPISNNYNVFATEKEIYFVDQFLNKLIFNIKKEKIINGSQYVSQYSTLLIQDIINEQQ